MGTDPSSLSRRGAPSLYNLKEVFKLLSSQSMHHHLTCAHAMATLAGKPQKRSGVELHETSIEEHGECQFPLLDLPEEVLHGVLEALPAQQLLSVSRVRKLG